MHTLRNIPRSKENQATKFGLLIEYNMRNIFLKKIHTKIFLHSKFFVYFKTKRQPSLFA